MTHKDRRHAADELAEDAYSLLESPTSRERLLALAREAHERASEPDKPLASQALTRNDEALAAAWCIALVQKYRRGWPCAVELYADTEDIVHGPAISATVLNTYVETLDESMRAMLRWHLDQWTERFAEAPEVRDDATASAADPKEHAGDIDGDPDEQPESLEDGVYDKDRLVVYGSYYFADLTKRQLVVLRLLMDARKTGATVVPLSRIRENTTTLGGAKSQIFKVNRANWPKNPNHWPYLHPASVIVKRSGTGLRLIDVDAVAAAVAALPEELKQWAFPRPGTVLKQSS